MISVRKNPRNRPYIRYAAPSACETTLSMSPMRPMRCVFRWPSQRRQAGPRDLRERRGHARALHKVRAEAAASARQAGHCQGRYRRRRAGRALSGIEQHPPNSPLNSLWRLGRKNPRVIWIKVTRRQAIREIGRNPINRVGADLGEAFPDRLGRARMPRLSMGARIFALGSRWIAREYTIQTDRFAPGFARFRSGVVRRRWSAGSRKPHQKPPKPRRRHPRRAVQEGSDGIPAWSHKSRYTRLGAADARFH